MQRNPEILAISNSETYIPLVLKNPLSSLVTALPYIDEENDNTMNFKVTSMIEDEMKQIDKHKNYLETLPEPKLTYLNSPEFLSEIERIRNDKEIIMSLMKRYELDDIVPLDKMNDPSIWKKLLDHLSIMHQYNNMKLFNVELMLKYGPEVWRKHVEESENLVKKMEEINKKLRFDVNELNAQRKFEQYEVGEKLNSLKSKINTLHDKNTLLEEECAKLENEVFNIRRKKMALQKPGDLNLLNFEQVVVHEDNNQTFEKKTVLDEFLLHQTMKNRSLANFCGLIYSLLFSVNCMCSTLYPYTSPENSVESLPSDFYLGIYVLIANVVSHLIFEKFAFRGKKTDWWKIQNLQVMAFCLTMTIAQIKYLINLDSNLLFRHYKFSHFWGYLQYPVILNMFILLMHGLLIKIMSIFISQSLLITFIMIGENPLENFEIAFVLILSFSYVVFFCLFAYVEEIHIKEKYEFYLNFHKSTLDWQNIINNVPHGIALFTKDHKRLIFSNHYGNQALKINISSPEKNCFDTLSNSLGDLKKISITNTAPYPQNTFLIDSEQRMINTMKSIKKYENSILEKGTLKEILNFLEENISIYDFKSTIAYKTSEKIKIPEESRNEMGSEEKNFIVKIKRINFESTSAFLLILEDNSQSELIATLKENNAYKSKLLSSFSHELRTPLNGAMPLLKNLYDDENFKRNDSEKHYQLCIAINSLSILQSVLNDIVDYAQINSNQLQLNCTDFEIKKTITECLDVVSLQIKEKLIDLNVFIDPNIPKRFCSDQNRLSQILLNILRNAIKFSGNGGKIKFFAKNLDVLKNDIISLKVVDQGVGMTPVELARLGELLQNLKNNECSETNNQLGSLGLLISQNLALILGPSKNNSNGLRIVSKQGQGTSVEFLIEDKNGLKLGGDECPCFSELKTKTQEKHKIQTPNIKSRTGFAKHTIFWLEAEKTDDGYDDIPSEGNERSQQIKTLSSFNNPLNFIEGSTGKKPKLPKDYCCEPILVVDDDPFNLLSAEVIIKKLGYSLIKANNGKNAIEIVEKRYSKPRCNRDCKGFALILMDYNMPVMNGIEATKYLKKKMSINEIPEIPIIACSAFGAKDDLLNCFEAGMNDYIAKPITLEKLENIFNKWIKRYEGG